MYSLYNKAQVHFELKEEIGKEGKNSKVFLAYDPQLDGEIVVKKIEKSKLSKMDEYFQESRLLYRGAHANVMLIYYACQDDDHIYFAMPYFSTGSIKSLMSKSHLSVRQIVVMSTQFLSGLHHIHSKGLIHFDIKPDNILISNHGEAVLSDFGLAKRMNFSGVAGQDRLYGKMTPPEAFRSDHFSNRIDIYQAGLTMYRMCVSDSEFYRQYEQYIDNGELKRNEFKDAIKRGEFPDRSFFPEHIPSKLKNTIKKCIEPDPSNRYSSVLEIINDLASIDGNILDWTYKVMPDGREWTKNCEDKAYKIIVKNDQSSVATKTIGTGSSRSIRDYCKARITPQEIRNFLKGY